MSNIRDLELRHLVALDAVATHGTFARAADVLGYTQSAVSQQIAALERTVDAKVFDRPGGPRSVELTPFGEVLLDRGRDLLTRVDALGHELNRFREGHLGHLTVGTFQSISSTVLPSIVGRFREMSPDVSIQLFESDSDEALEEQLASGETEVGFVVGDIATGFESRHLLTDPFVLIARPGQFPAGPVSIADLAREPMIGQRENSCQLLNEAGLRASGHEPNYVFRSNDNGTVAAMVRAGMGVAVMPLLCTEPEDPRTSLHELEPLIPGRDVSIAWLSGRTLSPAAEAFIELAIEVCHAESDLEALVHSS
ncbi:MAG: LysR family transcriptional regulator [Actinobacteria bacterium]|nr:MAG: LysR family transcriptional regulator [Actinomycetota bacterium]